MSRLKNFNFKIIKERAQGLRNNMTESERLLWKELRGRKVLGLRFLRQHPVIYKGNLRRYNYFITDFYCDKKRMIIEIDGPIHEKSQEYDQFRDSELHDMGFHILRIKNNELKNMQDVVNRIKSFLIQIPDIK